MTTDTPPLPDRHEWARYGISDVVELDAGKQSRVVRTLLDGAELAIKLTDRRFADPAVLTTRMAVVETLATDVTEVVAPQRIGPALVEPIGEWLMTATPFVVGHPVDPVGQAGGQLMGGTLARLHVALASVGRRPLPSVATLGDTADDAERSDWQLLHGDFNEQNLIVTPDGLRIIDFDDSGYGPIEFDVANALYMVLFDADVNDRPERYEHFRPAFLDGYDTESAGRLDVEIIDELIDERISALGRWLDDLANAPIGVRTSSAAWQDTLRTFVRSRGSASG